MLSQSKCLAMIPTLNPSKPDQRIALLRFSILYVSWNLQNQYFCKSTTYSNMLYTSHTVNVHMYLRNTGYKGSATSAFFCQAKKES